MSLLQRLQKFDAFPKTLEDFRVKTFSGAAVSIIAVIFITALFLSELAFFMSVEVNEELFVDTSRNEKMRINIDIVFPKMPCAYLSMDVMDVSGEHELDIDHDITKQRLKPDGTPVANGAEKHEDDDEEDDARAAALKKLDPNRCESCFGAETDEIKCCNTCEDIREAYRQKGWAFNNGQGMAQCEREGWSEKMAEQADEGCNMVGFLTVNKVPGNFHIAPGKSFQQHNVHVHDLQSFGRDSLMKFNMSHTVRKLSFGSEYPGQVNPLDDHVEYADEPGVLTMFQYFVKVVPTRYRRRGRPEIATNQYAVTMHQKKINPAAGQTGLPGFFVMFEISPIVVQLSEESRSFFHFLTGVCAIVGGVFTVAGMIDGFLYHGLRSLQKKNEIGKLG